jgi:hypothetical protein
MAERLNERVRVALSRGDVAFPWASRQELLGEIRHVDSAQSIVAAFEAVGTSRPVVFTVEQKALLIELIEFWGNQTRFGLKALSEGMFELRNALHDDLHDTLQRESK